MGTTPEELQYSDPPTRICGQDEAYAVDVYPLAGKNRVAVESADVISTGVSGSITVGTSAVEAKVGASRLTNRRVLTIQPTNGPVWIGVGTSITTATGTQVFTNQVLTLSVGDVTVFVISNAAGRDVRITEGA
jgi:hypothetical protein